MSLKDKVKSFADKFTVLRKSPRELGLVYLVNITEYIAYSFMQYSLMLWMLNDLKYSDESATYILMVWGMILSAITIFSGMITDGLGIKRSFLLGYLTCAIGRGFIAFTTNFWLSVVIGLGTIAVGMALMSPVVAAAIRRFTSREQRSMAFSMFYVLMNVGYAIGGWGWDMIREIVKNSGGTIAVGGFALTEFQFLFFISAAITVGGVVIIQLFIREGVEVDEETCALVPLSETKKEAENPIKILVEVVKEKQFWLFILFLSFLLGVKSVFYHMHYSLPPFADRYIGQGAKIGTAYGFLNPFIIVVFVPFIGAFTQKISSFKMIVLGSIISSFAVFILCIPSSAFAPIANGAVGKVIAQLLGVQGALHPWYIPLLIFVIIFTIGEGIWSPRLFEYTASIAPKGREGSYMSLSILPWFASKPLVALLQRWILPTYCPAPTYETPLGGLSGFYAAVTPDYAPIAGRIDPYMFWGIIGLTAISSPILILLFARIIRSTSEIKTEEKAAE